MLDFPDFMKNKMNQISKNDQNTEDIDGYCYEGRRQITPHSHSDLYSSSSP